MLLMAGFAFKFQHLTLALLSVLRSSGQGASIQAHGSSAEVRKEQGAADSR